MKAKDLPQEFKDMYGFKYYEEVDWYTINEPNGGFVISADAEFIEEKFGYAFRKGSISLVMSKSHKHATTIIL